MISINKKRTCDPNGSLLVSINLSIYIPYLVCSFPCAQYAYKLYGSLPLIHPAMENSSALRNFSIIWKLWISKFANDYAVPILLCLNNANSLALRMSSLVCRNHNLGDQCRHNKCQPYHSIF
jgi:hypothetical protein